MLELGPQQTLGAAAALVSFLAGGVYIVDIFRGRVRPHRATWWILGFLNCAIAASYFVSGARTTIWLPLEFGLSFLVIGGLSLKYGDGSWREADTYCLAGAVIGIFAWWFTRSAPVGLAVFVAVDLLGLTPTIMKAYRRPWTENSSAWAVGTVAGFLNVLAIDTWSPEISLYPVYVFLSSALIWYLTLGSRQIALRRASAVPR